MSMSDQRTEEAGVEAHQGRTDEMVDALVYTLPIRRLQSEGPAMPRIVRGAFDLVLEMDVLRETLLLDEARV